MFDAIFTGFAALLSFLYSVVPNYGIAIGLFTLVITILISPLTVKQMRSMVAMSKLQPEMKKLQEEYKDDPAKQNEATMALFREHGTSPLGCILPMLIQLPLFTIMYNLMRGLTFIPAGAETFSPKYLAHDSALYRALEGDSKMMSFGIDLSKTVGEAGKAGFIAAVPFLFLIIGVVVTNYYQQYMISRRNPQTPEMASNPMAKQMQTMTRFMPLMFLMFGFTLPGGLNLYYLFQALFRIVQQAIIYKLNPGLSSSRGAPTVAPDNPRAHRLGLIPPKPAPAGPPVDPPVTRATPSNANRSKRKKKRR